MLDYKLGSSYLYHRCVLKYFYKSFHKQSILVHGHFSSTEETEVKSRLSWAHYSNTLSQNKQTYKETVYLFNMVCMLNILTIINILINSFITTLLFKVMDLF